MKRLIFFFGIFVITIAIAGTIGSLRKYVSDRADVGLVPSAQGPTVRIGGLVIPVEIADTPATRSRGLSGRPSLEENRGMLFMFEKPGIYQFWMPDMQFPLDFIWIGPDRRVIGITENAPPLADISNPVWYKPPAPAQYVLEVNAGFAGRHNIQIGDLVTLP